MADSLISIASDALSAGINPLGAELWSLRDLAGRELMTDADPAFWTGHAPLLFPIVGRLNGDVYCVDGKDYALPQHGFARRRAFALIRHDEASALFRLEADAETLAVYPFAFRFDMNYGLEGAELRMTATIGNRGETDLPFSFGFHPAFAWPLPYGAPPAAHRIVFADEESAPVRRIAPGTGLIDPEPRPSPVTGRELALTSALFEGDALIWDDLASRSLRWGPPGGPGLDIGFPDTPWLGLWQKPGASYLCIEPWAGMADPAGFSGTIWDKPGIMRLAPGTERRFRMTVRLSEH